MQAAPHAYHREPGRQDVTIGQGRCSIIDGGNLRVSLNGDPKRPSNKRDNNGETPLNPSKVGYYCLGIRHLAGDLEVVARCLGNCPNST